MIILGGHLIKKHDLYAARLSSLWNGRPSATRSIRFPSGKPISKSGTSNASTWVRTRGRHRLCERIGRRTSLLETHADDVRAGWEREYTRAIKTVAKKPVLLVGRLAIPASPTNLWAPATRRRHRACAPDDRRRAVDDESERGARERYYRDRPAKHCRAKKPETA